MQAEAGLWGLFFSSFLASTLLPGGSEVAFLYARQQDFGEPLTLWALATLGNTLGGLTGWGIGFWLRRAVPERGLKRTSHVGALSRVQRFGSPILMLSWLPVIGDPLCLAAGWAGIPAMRAALFIAAGKGMRYALLLPLS